MAELPSYRCGNNVSVRDFAYGAKTNTLQVNDVYHIHYVLFPVGAETSLLWVGQSLDIPAIPRASRAQGDRSGPRTASTRQMVESRL
jgi:hypothetical protein